MTDKEIIIDGVDVSKCIHIDNWKHCNCCNDLIKTIYPKASQCLIEEDLRCEIYSNCYYKQLKRKEQECEELKQELQELEKDCPKRCKSDKYKEALDEIEQSASKHCISADDYNKMRNNKWVYAFSKGYATARWELINPILDIIKKVKE